MRDYGDLIATLRTDAAPLSLRAAEALQELLLMTGRMTSLGVDLESQIQEDLTPDYYAILNDGPGMTFMVTPEVLNGLALPFQLPMKFTALKVIGDSWIVKFPESDELHEFYSREALDEAVEDHHKGE
jgi:hypothetical protein